ncbi:MAG: fibronectin type III domain-containing protein, partial [Acidobacteriota bacterium]|nr:fibronectin type III domain-containing protein [Acidobacteriota bacterium]
METDATRLSLVGLLLLPGLAQAQSLLRFDVADGGQAATFQQSSVSRERTAGAEHPVQVDVALLRAAPPRLELATPDGRLLTAALTHFEDRGGGDVLWSGRIVGAGYDTVLLAVRAGRVVGSYREPARPAYSLRSDASGLGVVTAPSTGEAPVEDFPAESPFCQEVHAPLDPDAPESPMLPPPVSRDPTSIPDSSFEESAIVASTPPTGVARAQTAVTVTLTAAPGTVEEDAGSAQTITVTAEITAGGTFGTDQTILVSVGGGRATADVDYVAVADFSITLAASMTSGSASFALSPTNDTDREAHENVIVSGTLTGATVVPAEIWITDDDQHRIDLMILHTPEAAAEMTHSDGSTYTPTSIAGEFVDYANMVWRNAAFPAHLRLVHVGPVPARVLDNPLEGTPFVTAMRADAEVLRLREQYGADLVHLAIRVPGSIPLPCGLAYTRVAAHTTELMAPSGFGWFNVDNVCVQPGSNFVWGPGWGSILVHEIGHNLGLNHDPAHFTGSRYPPVAPYAFGHTDIRAGQTNVATIMSYGTDRSCRFVLGRLFCNDTFTREPFYSTVRIRGPDGAILGIADERENERAAWLTLASTERFDEFMQAAPPASLTGTVTANGDSVDVALTWNDVSTRETHFDVQYRIYGQAWRDGATLVANVQGTTLMGLAPATRYGFRVAATNAWGWTSYSYEWVTRTPGSGPPTPPANLRATTPGSQLIQGRVDLTWDDFAESETGFLVQYRELGAADWVDDPSLPADTTSAAVTGLLPDQDYEFRVGATNGHGAAWSLPVTARTDAPRPPTKPDGLVGLRLSSTTVLLSWGSSSDDVSLYEIQMRPHGAGAAWNSIAEAPRDVETKVVGNLPEGARLDFRVVALGLGGQARGDDVITVDLSVEPPGVPALAVRADRDSRNRAVARFRVSVEPLNGAEVYVERQVEVLRERRWRRVTDDVELGRDYDYFRAVAENAGGRRTSRIARLRDPGRELVRAPRRLAAEQTGPTEVRLTWEDRASDELWYRVGLSRDGGAEAVYAVYPPDTAEATLTGLWPGSYEFGLSVANAHGGISPRTVALTLVPPDPSPPPAASGLTASHGATSTEVELSWTDNSSDETGFRVGARPDDGAWTYTDVAADAVTATVSNLMADTLYHFRVLAESPRGSLESNRAILDLQRTPRPPTGLRARADGSTSVVLSWKDEAVNETGYRIEYRPGGGSWVQDGALAAADAESRAVTGLAPSTAYGFRVVAVNAAGENATDEVTLTMPPAAPSNLQVSASSATSAALTWTDNSSDETGFLIQYRASDQTGWTVWAPDPAADAGSAAIEGLTPGSDYEFRVFAHGDHGTSSPSNVASVTDFPRLPEAPSGLSVSFLDSNACAVSWTDNSSDETGFLIQYRLVGRTEWDAGPAFPADATAGTLGGLLPSRTYRFRVLARNANGARPSFQREATSPPAAPTELEASRASGTMANLEWVDNARDETGFLVEERRGANPWYPIGRVANPRASIGGIVPLAVRDWRVRAYNDNGVSAPSNAVTYVERSAPPAPAGLTAVATGSTSVDLSWVDNSDVEGGFRVERRAAGETTWTTGGAVAADATGASVTGLVASTAYTFRVVAFNANGVGESDPVSLTMPPPAPTGLSASLATSTSAQLAWTDNASDEDGYLAQYSDGSAWTTALTTASGATSAVVSGLTAGSGYEFRVLATNANGDSSPSNVVGLGPPLAPPAPSGLVAAAAGSTSVNLSWSDGSSNETGFQVEYQPSGGAWTAASTTPPDTEAAVVTGLAPSTGYQFRVTATNANGSASSGVASLVMPPAAPTGLSARAGAANAVDLAWTDAASDESEFLVEYRRRVDSAWTAWGTRPAANASAASVTGLLGGTEYLFRVRAVHATNGASTPSNVAATSTSGTRVPSGLRVAATDSTSASASWEDESHDETGFVVERRRTGGDWNVAAAVDVDVESAVLTGLEPSAAYDFRVGATGAGGSAWSGTVSLTMPPAAPVGLEAAAASSTSARLTWTDTSSDETSFVIEFREESAPDWGLWPGEAAADAETWTATGLDPGKAYAFRVYAKHSTNGVSSPSNEARTGNLGAPRPPSGLAAAAAGSTTVNLTWTDDATDETGFLVEYRSGAAAWRTSSSPSADAESAAATGLTASRGYEFRVSALNARGSTPSSSVTLVMPPAPPRRIRAEAGDGADVLVIWDDGSEDETGYALEYRLSSATAWTEWSADLPTNPTSALVTGLAAGASYQFRAFALHPRNGRSSPSDVATVNMVGAPAAPSGLVSLPRGSTEVSLTWIDNSSNETAFDVEQRTGTGPWSTVATNGPNVNWATITGLSPSTAYGFRVSARNANGATPGGAVSQTMPPAAPTNLVATEWKPASDNPGVELTWTDNATDERDFLVEYRAAGDEAWLAFSTRPPADSTSFVATGLTPDTAYEFRVFATSRHGNSSPSNVATVAGLGVPEAPTDFAIEATGSTTALATWTDASTKEAVFRVQRRAPGAEEWTEAAIANRNETSIEVPNLLPSTAYEFRVVSWTVSGASGSNVVGLTMPPAPPADLTAAPASPTSVSLTWTDASRDETSFVAEYKRGQRKDWTVFGTEAAANATSLTVTGLVSGQTYDFRVYARHGANGRSSPSNQVRVRKLGTAGVPADVSVTASGSTSVVVAWTDNGADETGFRVEYRIGRSPWATGAETGANSTTATVTGLLPSTSYEFRVSSLNAHGAAASDSVLLVMPPAAPTGLVAAGDSATGVRLDWTDASTDEARFVAEYREAGATAWTAFGTAAAANATSITVTGLTSGRSYEFRVFAENDNGRSSPSGVASPAGAAAPVAPSGATAVARGSTTALIAWSDNSTDETGFDVEYRVGSAAWRLAAQTAASVTRLAIAGLEASTAYEFRVSARNGNGASAAAAAPVLTMPPAAPTGLTATRTSSTGVLLGWTDNSSDETAFVVEYKTLNAAAWSTFGTEAAADATSISVTGLATGTRYVFRVFAKHSVNGLSTPSYTVSVHALGAPAAPTGLTATASAPTAVALAWTDASNTETGFRVEARRAAAGVPWTLDRTVLPGTTSATVARLRAGAAYEFRVGAENSAGVSYAATVAARTPADSIPMAPTGLAVTGVGPTRVRVDWTDRAGNEAGYIVSYRFGAEAKTVWSVYPADQETALFTGLGSGQYTFFVRATNAVGESAEASASWSLPRPSHGPPKAATRLNVKLTGPYTAELRWRDRADDETEYLAALRADDGAWRYASSAPDSTRGFFHGLLPGETYHARVIAYHADNGGINSNVVTFENPADEPRAARDVTVTPTGSTSLVVAWEDVSREETGYEVQYRIVEEDPDAGDEAPWTTAMALGPNVERLSLDRLLSSTTYRFAVWTIKNGKRESSEVVEATMPPPPPVAAAARPASASSAEVSWTDASTDETSFQVEHRLSGAAAWTASAGAAGADETAFVVTGLEGGSSYEFRVFARHDVNGLSSPSNVARTETAEPTLTIAGLSSGTVAENVAYASATPSVSGHRGAVTWTTEGADAADFTIASGTGALSMVARDHEDPQDDDLDNVYEVTVKATDADGVTGTASIAVTVTDVNEPPVFSTATALSISVPEG